MKLGFFREPLKVGDVLLLFLIIILIWFDYFLLQQNSKIEVAESMKITLLVILWLIPIATPFAEKLRNIYIFSIWGTICLFFLFLYRNHLSFLPMFSLVYSTLCRLIFRSMFNNFPIQLWGSWFATVRYSKLEKRFSNKRDLYFSIIIFLSGIIIPIIIGYFLK